MPSITASECQPPATADSEFDSKRSGACCQEAGANHDGRRFRAARFARRRPSTVILRRHLLFVAMKPLSCSYEINLTLHTHSCYGRGGGGKKVLNPDPKIPNPETGETPTPDSPEADPSTAGSAEPSIEGDAESQRGGHPAPYTLQPKSYYTLHPTPHTLHPTPSTLNLEP